MEIKATVNGTEYKPVSIVTAGGKTALLTAEAALEDKEITIVENGDTEVTPSVGKDGIGSVIIHTDVQGGGGIDALLYTKVSPQFDTQYPDVDPVIYCPFVTVFDSAFAHQAWSSTVNYPYQNITIKSDAAVTSLKDVCYITGGTLNSALETLTLDMDLSHVTNYSRLVGTSHANFEELKGTPLDFSSVITASNSNWISSSSGTNVTNGVKARYKSNTLSVNHSIQAKFNDDTLVSIANGLKSGAHTLTLHADNKARLSTIMGTTSQVSDDTGTYDFFTADASGSTSLENFITTTKGWTLG